MRLYYSPNACSLAVRIILNELNIPTHFIQVNLKTKKTENGQDYLEINSKGNVPMVQLDDGTKLTENAVILQYLVDQQPNNPLLPKLNDFRRYRILEWLNFITTDIHKTCAPLFNPELPEDARDFFKNLLKRKLDYTNDQLSPGIYLTGEDFSIADAYLYVVLRWLEPLNFDMTLWPNFIHFSQMVKERPAVQKSLKEENLY